MKRKAAVKKTYCLSVQTIDEISSDIEQVCQQFNVERRDMLRYRLSAEESLAAWLEAFGEGAPVSYEVGYRLGRPYFRIGARGAHMNPYDNPTEDFGNSKSILISTGLFPYYAYNAGTNNLTFYVRRKSLNPLVTLLLIILAALAVGLLGRAFLPASVITFLSEGIITPVEDTMFRILSCIAGPMIFLSVAWGIYGIGDVYTLGRVGKKLMLNYLMVAGLFCVFGCVFYPLLGPALSSSNAGSSQFSQFFEMILNIFPGDPFSPFIDGNTLQIIFLAVVIGISLIFLGQRTASVARAVEQINNIINFLMTIIARFVPYFVFVVLVQIIWSDNFAVFSSIWRFALVVICAELVMVMASTLYISLRNKVSFGYILRSCLPSYLIALTTASSAATFDSNMTIIRKKLGVSDSLASFSVPFGTVMFKPNTGLYYLLLCFYFASSYDVSVSFGWILTAIVITAISSVATSPIPGGSAATYTILFLQLGIPAEALAVVLAIDMIFDFVLTSGDMFMLLVETFHVSVKIGMQDMGIIRKEQNQ